VAVCTLLSHYTTLKVEPRYKAASEDEACCCGCSCCACPRLSFAKNESMPQEHTVRTHYHQAAIETC